jgi:hypothetical protein
MEAWNNCRRNLRNSLLFAYWRVAVGSAVSILDVKGLGYTYFWEWREKTLKRGPHGVLV